MQRMGTNTAGWVGDYFNLVSQGIGLLESSGSLDEQNSRKINNRFLIIMHISPMCWLLESS